MKIPRTFKLYGKKVRVRSQKGLAVCHDKVGEARYRKREILLQCLKVAGIPYRSRDIEEVFHEELTHFILSAMDHDLAYDERFVKQFARLLYQSRLTEKGVWKGEAT